MKCVVIDLNKVILLVPILKSSTSLRRSLAKMDNVNLEFLFYAGPGGGLYIPPNKRTQQ